MPPDRDESLLDILLTIAIIVVTVLFIAHLIRPAKADMATHPLVISDSVVGYDADCSAWAPWIDDDGNRVWRSDTPTVIQASPRNMRVRGDATWNKAPTLWDFLENLCGKEAGAGIGIVPVAPLPEAGGG